MGHRGSEREMVEELAARYAAGRLYVGCLHGLRQLQGGFDRRKQPQTDRSLLVEGNGGVLDLTKPGGYI
eukprot:SAG22_NODE_2273_length_2766_cov_2.731159_3_plen_69_part_00